jgi:hypothetical protein
MTKTCAKDLVHGSWAIHGHFLAQEHGLITLVLQSTRKARVRIKSTCCFGAVLILDSCRSMFVKCDRGYTDRLGPPSGLVTKQGRKSFYGTQIGYSLKSACEREMRNYWYKYKYLANGRRGVCFKAWIPSMITLHYDVVPAENGRRVARFNTNYSGE